MYDYQVVMLPIPSGEAVTLNEDGSYTIFIDCNLSPEAQKRHFIHALIHIYKDDFYKHDICADLLEFETHSICS